MATLQILKKVKLASFSGSSYDEHIRLWISSLDEYYDAMETDATERLTATPLLFEGTAKRWWQNIRGAFHTNDGTWLDLKQALCDQFEDPNSVQNARDQIARLHQRTSVVRYLEAFNELRAIAGDITEAESIQRFRDGLKAHLQQHFRGNPDHCRSLAQVQKIAASLDNSQYQYRRSAPTSRLS